MKKILLFLGIYLCLSTQVNAHPAGGFEHTGHGMPPHMGTIVRPPINMIHINYNTMPPPRFIYAHRYGCPARHRGRCTCNRNYRSGIYLDMRLPIYF